LIIGDRYAFVSTRLTLDDGGSNRFHVRSTKLPINRGESRGKQLSPGLVNYPYLSTTSNRTNAPAKIDYHEIIVYWIKLQFKS